MHKEWTVSELAGEQGELLPAREALALVNVADVMAHNASLALNAVTENSTALSFAAQAVTVDQY